MKKVLRRANCRCFLPVATVLKISGITVKTIVLHHFFSERQHMIRQISANLAAQDNIHIISHPEIGDQYGKMVQILSPFLLLLRKDCP